MPENFQIKLVDFEGPIEVLLRLIEEKKLHISQVSLAAVADDFVTHLGKIENGNKEQMANFILVASTLMLIKSISLLPKLQVTEEEKGSMEDLEKRLQLYQEIKKLSENIKVNYGKKIIFAREPGKEIVSVFSPSRDLNLANLKLALERVIANLPKVEKLPEVIVQKVLSLEEAIESLATRVQSALKTSFQHFVKDKKEKVNIIVSFLGMLELVKRGIVQVEQASHFQDIAIETTSTIVPKYG
ncbi:segregation/condensation protein A [Candidatus Nomurabacteria bacterium]|nr:segregation/condensation protein A [Candidatus Nomurabacteria bacterium]